MTPEEEARLLDFVEQQSNTQAQAAQREVMNRPRIGMTEAALLGGLDGLTFGWGDEAAGLFDPNLKKRLRERYELARDQQGGAFFAGALGSSFVPGLGLLGLAGKLGRAGSLIATGGKAVTTASRLAQRARAAAGAGIPAGILYGAGGARNSQSTEPGADPRLMDRVLGGIGGGVAGGVIGGAFPLASAALMRMGKVAHMPVRAAMQAVTGKPDIARAEAALFERIKQDYGDDAATALEAAYWRDRAKGGSKPALIDLKPKVTGQDGKAVEVAPENVLRLTEYAGAAPGPGRNLVRAEVARRQEQQASRVEDWIEKKTGGDNTYQDDIAALNAAQQEAAGPLYAQLHDIHLPADPRLREIMARPAVRHAVQKAIELGLNKGWNLQRMGMVGEDELVKLFSRMPGVNSAQSTPMGGSMSLAGLDLVKQALDDAIMVARNPASGFGLNARGALKKTAAEFTAALDDAVARAGKGDIYRQARDAHAGFAALKDAAELGRSVFTPGAHSDWMSEAMALSTQSERDAALIGLRDAMLEKAWNAKDGADLYRLLLGSKGARMRIASLFGPIGANGGFSPGANRFFGQVRKEAERLMNINQVYSRTGSQTQPRMLEQSDTDEALGQALVNVLTGDVRGAMMIGLGKATKAAFGKSPLTPKEAEHVVRESISPLHAVRYQKATKSRPEIPAQPLELAARLRAWEARLGQPKPYRALASQATARGAIALN